MTSFMQVNDIQYLPKSFISVKQYNRNILFTKIASIILKQIFPKRMERLMKPEWHEYNRESVPITAMQWKWIYRDQAYKYFLFIFFLISYVLRILNFVNGICNFSLRLKTVTRKEIFKVQREFLLLSSKLYWGYKNEKNLRYCTIIGSRVVYTRALCCHTLSSCSLVRPDIFVS